jgi:hypothetical protein
MELKKGGLKMEKTLQYMKMGFYRLDYYLTSLRDPVLYKNTLVV